MTEQEFEERLGRIEVLTEERIRANYEALLVVAATLRGLLACVHRECRTDDEALEAMCDQAETVLKDYQADELDAVMVKYPFEAE